LESERRLEFTLNLTPDDVFRANRGLRNSRVYWSELKYVITEKRISASGPTFSAESDWSNVAGVRETKSLFIVLPRAILPKRCFADAAALEIFRELVRPRVSGNVKLLS
jgi:YcxB-like protein